VRGKIPAYADCEYISSESSEEEKLKAPIEKLVELPNQMAVFSSLSY
jgi:hypothetical protein